MGLTTSLLNVARTIPASQRLLQSFDAAAMRAERVSMRALDGVVALADRGKSVWRPTPPSTSLTQIVPINVSQWTIPDVRVTLDSFELGQFMDASVLADAMGRDDRIVGCLGTRVRALAGKNGVGFSVEPSTRLDETEQGKALNDRIAKEIDELWQYTFPEPVMSRILRDAVMMGVSVCRIHWDLVGNRRVPRLEPWDPRGIWWDWSIRKYRAIAQEGIFSIDPSTAEWFVFEPGGYRGWMHGAIRCLGIGWLIRQMTFRDWARYSEKHGMPMIAVKEPSGTQWDKHKTSFWGRMKNIGGELLLRLPTDEKGYGFGVEMIEAKARSQDAFLKLIQRLDTNISITLLGQNLSTEVVTGSHAAAQAHELVRLDYLDADAQTLSTTARRQVWQPFVRFNYEGADEEQTAWPRWATRPPEDKKANAAIFAQVVGAIVRGSGMGVRPTDPKFTEKNFGFGLDIATDVKDMPLLSSKVDAAAAKNDPNAPGQSGPDTPPGGSPAPKGPGKDPGESGGPPDGKPPSGPVKAPPGGAAGPPPKGEPVPPPDPTKPVAPTPPQKPTPPARPTKPKTPTAPSKPAKVAQMALFAGTAIGDIRTIAGVKVRIDRPAGFVQTGTDASGTPWSRTYKNDYGELPDTEGGDGDAIDVFCGPLANPVEVYWVLQRHADQSFDEFKLFLGFANLGDAVACFLAHIPAQYLGSTFTMPVSALRGLLGMEPGEARANLTAMAATRTG